MNVALDLDVARAATREELAHYWENGWVKMEGLISPDLAAEMLQLAKVEIIEKQVDNTRSHERPVWRDAYNLGRDDGIEPFATFVRSPTMGRNAQRFMRRDVSVGLHNDMIAVKMPRGHGSPGRSRPA